MNIDVIKCIAEVYEFPPEKVKARIQSRRRFEDYTRLRHLYWYIENMVMGKSLTNIGKESGVDHSTVIHGRDNIQDQIDIKSAHGVVYEYAVNKVRDNIRVDVAQEMVKAISNVRNLREQSRIVLKEGFYKPASEIRKSSEELNKIIMNLAVTKVKPLKVREIENIIEKHPEMDITKFTRWQRFIQVQQKRIHHRDLLIASKK